MTTVQHGALVEIRIGADDDRQRRLPHVNDGKPITSASVMSG